MIMIATKAEKSSSPSQLPLTDKSSSGDSKDFSKLLQSISSSSAQKTDKKSLKEGALLLELNDSKETADVKTDTKESSKKSELLSLLKNDATQDSKTFIINPQAAAAMDAKTLKNAIKDAKEYLKDQIKNSLAYKKGEIKELPKTTKGLVALAKKVGIDVEKITLETVQVKTGKEMKNIKLDSTAKTAQKQDDKPEVKTAASQTASTLSKQEPSQSDSLSKIPLFKTSQNLASSFSTAELVDKKQNKGEKNVSKTESTLIALLHGNKNINKQALSAELKTQPKAESKIESKHKAHSSVLSQLLHGDSQDNKDTKIHAQSDTQVIKPVFSNAQSTLHVKEADQDLGAKIHEAKQMVKYLAHDIKQAIEDYKPPFTRIKVKLNPAKLGEVDLTVVQRGKNVHVNISSNQSAINTLAQNASDLKVQLNQNGMNNASLNFNSSADNQSQQQQQQNGHHKENAKKAYEYFDNDEANEEVLSSLEIVIPRYI
ncbi:flagellar hook-length control protein FliK [Sulfurimonas sp. HSL-1716]|uniref:flagellar hook-length control protein FliK n=1 Tax=Hydrocurvibacter sulfurireducens TaxID=3131937 RepID=UPI0031F9A2F8